MSKISSSSEFCDFFKQANLILFTSHCEHLVLQFVPGTTVFVSFLLLASYLQ